MLKIFNLVKSLILVSIKKKKMENQFQNKDA